MKSMTLEALTARLDAIDDCYDMLLDVYVELGTTSKNMFEQLREKLQYSRNITWNDITKILDDMSKQA